MIARAVRARGARVRRARRRAAAIARPPRGTARRRTTMAAAVEKHGWDGDWFLRAYDHAGQPIGSRGNGEGRIFLEPQALCAHGGHRRRSRARRSRAAERFRAARLRVRRAAARPAVPRLPQRARRDLDLPARLQGKRLGVLPHQSVADHRRGDARPQPIARCRYLRAIAPTYQSDPATRRTEPYVYAQMVAGRRRREPGEAKNSWLTGTASWSHMAVTQYILGTAPDAGGPRRRSLHPGGLAVLQRAPRFRGATLRDRSREPAQRPRRAQHRRRRPGRLRQRHPAGGTGHDGPGDGRARLSRRAGYACEQDTDHGRHVRAA